VIRSLENITNNKNFNADLEAEMCVTYICKREEYLSREYKLHYYEWRKKKYSAHGIFSETYRA